jgi:hypothetical protein
VECIQLVIQQLVVDACDGTEVVTVGFDPPIHRKLSIEIGTSKTTLANMAKVPCTQTITSVGSASPQETCLIIVRESMYRDGKVPKKARQQSRKQDNTMIQNVGRVNTLEKYE